MKNISIKITWIILSFAFAAALLEGASYIIISRVNNNSGNKLKFNRELSGYMVFKNTPDFTYNTIKDDTSRKDIRTDDYGLICDEPLTFKKDANTVRIFLMGGSAMIGSGQNAGYRSVKKFPQGTYCYDLSIAGYLKAYLKERFPGKKIQVVNAACYGRQLHQSMIYYLETVSQFSPDIIIDMDGYNDIQSICTGHVFDLAEFLKLKAYVDLKVQSEKRVNTLKSVQLVSYLFAKRNKITGQRKMNYYVDTTVNNMTKYKKVKTQLQNSSGALLQVLNQYMNILKGDSVHFLFVLQPILDRGLNKPLGDYELRMRNEIGTEDATDHLELYDDPRFNLKTVNESEAADSLKALSFLTRRYFFDDWLSEQIQAEVEAKGFAYADMNKEIEGLDKDFEFYTDYCHMTKQAHKLVAEKMGEQIVKNNFIR